MSIGYSGRVQQDLFQRISTKVANWMGSAGAFVWSCIICILWALSGPWFDYSNSWQLVINTGTTVATFLMVFLVQNTQNRDAKALHIKLDELLKAIGGARNSLVSAEELTDKELDQLLTEFRAIHDRYAQEVKKKGGQLIIKKEEE